MFWLLDACHSCLSVTDVIYGNCSSHLLFSLACQFQIFGFVTVVLHRLLLVIVPLPGSLFSFCLVS